MDIKKLMASALLVATLANFSGCTGGGGGGVASTYGSYMSPYVSVTAFVDALNRVDGTYLSPSAIMLYTDQTLRSAIPGQESFFVIWDAKFNKYKAVSLQYVRSIVYYDYYSNTTSLADEFRNIESNDILNGNVFGDFFGDNYETVTSVGLGIYQGMNSSMLYDDEEKTEDVMLEMQDSEQNKVFEKAALYSASFQMSLHDAFSLVSFEKLAKSSLGKGEYTVDDLNSLSKSFEKFTKTSLNDLASAVQTQEGKDKILSEIASNIGMKNEKFQNRIVPEMEKMFGL